MSQLSLSCLVTLCRGLRTGLAAGLTVVDVFRSQTRSGPSEVRPVAERIGEALQRGESLEDALTAERASFPPLFISLTTVGEQSGRLPEVFAQLEGYFELRRRLTKQFRKDILWPVFELSAAVVVIFLMLLILEMLGGHFNPLGIGPWTFLAIVASLVSTGVVAYFALTRGLGAMTAVHWLLLRLPAIGPCLEAFALVRFCIALHATMEAGMSAVNALRRSFAATGNPVYEQAADEAVRVIKSGGEFATALESTAVFPEDFLHIVAAAEEAGTIPERMAQQAVYYEEEASHRMTLLTKAASLGVWILVAAMMIFAIMRIAMSYIGMIDKLAS